MEQVVEAIQGFVWEGRSFTAGEVKLEIDNQSQRDQPTSLLPFVLVFSVVSQNLIGLVKSGPYYTFCEKEGKWVVDILLHLLPTFSPPPTILS